MHLDNLPSYLYQVSVSGRSGRGLSRVFTSRDDVRTYRADLRSQGFTAHQIQNTRFEVTNPQAIRV